MNLYGLVASAIGAAGTVLSGYIALRVAQTRNIVNGQMDALNARVARLSVQLEHSQMRVLAAENPSSRVFWPPADPDEAA